jgi:hypothetical protein
VQGYELLAAGERLPARHFTYPEHTHGVEVTGEPLRRGIASLKAHAAYLAALPNHGLGSGPSAT